MAFIEPDSNIWILTGVPLDKSYTHTYYPWANGDTATRTTQFNSFINNYLRSNVVYKGKTYSYALTKYSFLRHNRNSIRVKMPIELLYDCNYIIFENTAYNYSSSQRKKFYAFIDDVTYINDNTTEISYTIDVMQTWHFDYSLEPCFVEREHTVTDNRGANILAEPVDIGDAVFDESVKLLDLESDVWYIVFVVTFDPAVPVSAADGQFAGGSWHQCDYVYYPVSGPNAMDMDALNSSIKSWLTQWTIFGRQSGIVSMYMCPLSLVPPFQEGDYETFNDSLSRAQARADVDITLRPSYPSWTPHNAKLLTYPYCYFTIDNQQGTIREYKYEMFKDCRIGNISAQDMLFRVFLCSGTKPMVRIVPINYMYTGANNQANFEYSIDITDFAVCTWATNDFVAKMVQGGMALALAAATGVGGIGAGAHILTQGERVANNSIYTGKRSAGMTLNSSGGSRVNEEEYSPKRYSGEMVSGIDTEGVKELGKDFVKVVSSMGLLALRTNHYNSIGNGNLNLASGCFDFIAKSWHCDVRYAKLIDNFFDMYGYATNEVKVPNRNSRPYFNYVKTSNCKLHNELAPQDAIEQIENIYNNGITFWKNLNTVGNYQYAINGSNIGGVM